MKIGLVRRGYSSTGGAESYLRRLAMALENAGHQCTLYGSPAWPRAEWPANRELVAVAGRTPRRFADAFAALDPDSICDLLFSLERVWSCDCYRAGDGVHQAWLERRARLEPAWKSRLRRWNPKHRQLLALEQALFSPAGAGMVIANSQLVRDEILAHYPAYPAERIAVVYNGLPVGAYRPATSDERQQARTLLGLAAEAFVILFAGTGWERKGCATRSRRWHECGKVSTRFFSWQAAGDRWHFCALPEAGGRVHFLGAVRDMASCYAAADVFVLPTLYDPFSNACLEALASGLPVLTTDANGFSEILDPGVDGDIVSVADRASGQALATMLETWADPVRRAAATAACVAKASKFSMERNVRHTLENLAIR